MPHNSWGAGLVNNENKLGTLPGKEMRGHLLALKQFAGENNNNVKVHISGHMSIPSCLLSAQWEISTRLISFCTVTANMTCPMPEQRLPGLDSCLFWRQGTGAFVSLYLRCWEYAKWAFLSRGFPRPSIFFFFLFFPGLPSYISELSLGVIFNAWGTQVHRHSCLCLLHMWLAVRCPPLKVEQV